jgi:hypothetical protein
MPDTCGTGRFYEPDPSPGHAGFGQCHAHPPTPVSVGPTVFPILMHDQWCGEWTANDKEPAPPGGVL